MKRIYLLWVMLVASALSSVTAQTRVQIGDLYYNLEGNEASVASNEDDAFYASSYNNNKYIIPSTIEYKGMIFAVTSVGKYAFSHSNLGGRGSKASSIVLPNSIIKIGHSAFRNCKNLVTMVIPNSVVSIEDNNYYSVFDGCNLLRTLIYLPSTAPDNWTATSNTYVPCVEEYSSPRQEINNAKVIEMLTFNDKATTYGEAVDINDCKVNIADCGYELAGLTVKNQLNTDVGEWCDTLHAQFVNDGADVPVLDVDIPFHHTVAKAKLTAKVVSVSRQYGEANPTFKVVYSGFVNNEDESVLEEPVEVSVNADESSPAGTYTISLSGGKAKNYDIIYEPGTLTVTKAPLTARVKNAERTYGEPNPDFQIEYTGQKNGETAPVWSTQPTVYCAATARSNVGDYAVTATGGVPRDYELSGIMSGRLTVTKAPLQVRAESAQRFYYEQNPALKCVYAGFVNGDDETALTKQPTVTTSAVLTSKAGTYPIKASGGEAQKYSLDYTDGELTVLKRSLTVTSPDYERAYGEANPEITLSYAGFVNNETESVLTQKPTAVFEASETSDVGMYRTLISGGEADNYDFVYDGGMLTITKADQTLTWEQDLSQIEVGSQIELTAAASSGLDVTYIVPDNNFVSLYKAGTRTMLDCYGTGTLIIRAVQDGNKNYYSSERLSKTLTVVSHTAISDVASDGYKVFATPKAINLSGIPEGVKARVYSLDGALLYQGHDGKVDVQSGTYIVVVGDKKTKILVK